jgi:glucose dehydrogenase
VTFPAQAAPTVDDGNWTMAVKDYASTRSSSLDEINRDNVAQLQVAFTLSLGVERGQEAAPLVVGDTMYVVTPFPNILYALDLTKPGAPQKWKSNQTRNRPHKVWRAAMWSIAAPRTGRDS